MTTDPPYGSVTFLFTDIEGSTTRWEQHPELMRAAVARHDTLLRAIMQTHQGYVFKTVGDAFYVAFALAGAALSATLAAQQALFAEPWSEEISPFRVRMALHSGEAELRNNDYFGQPLNRVARILSTGHGGQILLSQTILAQIHTELPAGVTFQDLGRHRLKDIQHPVQIFQLSIEGLPAQFPPLKSLNLHPHNLPAQLLPCVGREKELGAVREILLRAQVRLMSLIGPGGIGKTRFGLYVATSVMESFPDGVWFVELAAMRDTDAIIPAIFQAMGIYETTQQLTIEHLKDHMEGKTALFLDSVEQVNDAHRVVSTLLNLCPQLKILVSSRSELQLPQEYAYRMEPLALPQMRPELALEELLKYGAVALFVQQAQFARADFALNCSNASTVVKICKRLDGLPLAIELAAAQIKILSVQSMLKRLEKQMQFLEKDKKQQTLRKTLEWSYNLLSFAEKALLKQLTIFRSTCTFEAIEAICISSANRDFEVFDLLKELIDKSLLRQQEGTNGEVRFHLTYIIRAYAVEKLEKYEGEELQQRHASYYLEMVERVAPALTGFEQRATLALLEEEQENVQTAFAWYIEQSQLTAGFRMVEALWRFWWMNGHIPEGCKWLDTLLASEHVEAVSLPLRSRCLVIASRLTSSQNDYERATLLAEQALTLSHLSGDKQCLSAAYTTQAEVAFHKGAYEQAVQALEQSLVIQRELGNRRTIASLLNNLGNVVLHQGDLVRASSLQEESLRLFRVVKDEWAIATVLNSLGEVERRRGNYKHAKILYEEALKLCRSLGYSEGTATSLVSLGDIARYQENYTQASVLYKESLALFSEIKNRVGITVCLQGLAEIAYIQERLELATRLFAQAEVTAYALESSVLQYERDTHSVTLDQLRTAFDYASFNGFWTTGQVATLEQIMLEVLDE